MLDPQHIPGIQSLLSDRDCYPLRWDQGRETPPTSWGGRAPVWGSLGQTTRLSGACGDLLQLPQLGIRRMNGRYGL